jgi:hypothetical protein
MADPNFQFDPPTGHNDTTEFLTNPPKEAVRGYMQRLHDQTRDFINNTLMAWIKETFLTPTGDFRGTINGGDVTLTEPGLSGAFNAHKADNTAHGIDTYLADNMLSVDSYIEGDGAADDTDGLEDAIAAAKAAGRGLYCSPTKIVRITSTVDFRNVKVIDFQGAIKVDFEGVGIIMGGESSIASRSTKCFFNEVSPVIVGVPANPCIRIVGLRNSKVEVNDSTYIQLYADTDDETTSSIAYSNFHIGYCLKLELTTNPSPVGSTTQWINENTFWGGRFKEIIFSGTYSHSNNVFYRPTLENATLDIQVGISNAFYDARLEGTNIVNFGENTHSNIITQLYASSMVFAISTDISATVTDLGSGNVYCHSQALLKDQIEILSINKNTKIYDLSAEKNILRIGPGIDYLTQADGNSLLIKETELIPVTNGSQFLMISDSPIWKLWIYLYDENKELITAAVDPDYINMTSKRWVVEGSYYDKSGNFADIRFQINSNVPKYVRLEIRAASGTGKKFKYFNLFMFQRKLSDFSNFNVGERDSLPIQATSPTKGFAKLGEIVANSAGGVFVCKKSISQTLASTAVLGATSVTVTDATGIADGDIVGILLDTGVTDWRAVAGLSGTSFNVTALTGQASAGNRIVFNKWV